MNIDDQLDGLRKIRPVDAPPFLLTRIKSRIDSLDTAPAPLQWTWSFAGAALMVLAVNTGILLNRLNPPEDTGVAQVVSAMQLTTNNDLYHD